MTRFVVSAAATTVVAGAVTVALLMRGGDPRWVLDVLARVDEPVYAVWYSWLLVAPLVLVAAAVVVRRSPWPWVVAATVHLAGLAAAAARLENWLPAWGWPALVVAVGIGMWSAVEALRVATDRDGSSRGGPIR